MKVPPYRIKNMMPGMIMMWPFAIEDIPSGWHLCDGTMGTPDLRNRVIIGAGDIYAVGDTGGAINHLHGFTGDGHDHTLLPELHEILTNIEGEWLETTDIGFSIGSTDFADSRQPYHALACIQKL